MKKIDQISTWALIAVTTSYIVVALGYQDGAATVPLVVAGVTLLIAGVQLVGPRFSLLSPLVGEIDDLDDGGVLSDPLLRRRLYICIASLGLVLILIFLFGPVVGLPVYVLLFMTFIARQSFSAVFVSTAIVAVAVYSLLVVLVSYPADSGYVWTIL